MTFFRHSNGWVWKTRWLMLLFERTPFGGLGAPPFTRLQVWLVPTPKHRRPAEYCHHWEVTCW